jgi:hypothetical protein
VAVATDLLDQVLQPFDLEVRIVWGIQ